MHHHPRPSLRQSPLISISQIFDDAILTIHVQTPDVHHDNTALRYGDSHLPLRLFVTGKLDMVDASVVRSFGLNDVRARSECGRRKGGVTGRDLLQARSNGEAAKDFTEKCDCVCLRAFVR